MDVKLAGVVGLGLMGGSIAKALKEKLNIDVLGIDVNEEYIKQAKASGVIIDGSSNLNWLKDCDIIFLCAPISECINTLEQIAKVAKPGAIITDVASTKERIVEHATKVLPSHLAFIGGHPMTGSEKSGFAESRSHLFENAYYLLTPLDDIRKENLDTLINLIKGFGALPLVLDAKEHDLITAVISHVPHIIASALVNTVKTLDDKEGHMHKLAAGGFKDITRIASSDPVMWENICISNNKNICNIIDKYIQSIINFKSQLEKNHDIYNFFSSAKTYRDSFPSINRGSIEPLYNLYVDIPDKPGVIGEVATILGKRQINIKNIGISNSREYQAGCLVISFNTKEHLNHAHQLLEKEGYTVGQ